MAMANKAAAFLSSYKSHRYACNFIVTGKLCLLWWLWTSVYDQRGACNVPYLAGSLTACTGNVRLEIQGQEQMEGDRKHKNVCNTSWPCRAHASEISAIEFSEQLIIPLLHKYIFPGFSAGLRLIYVYMQVRM